MSLKTNAQKERISSKLAQVRQLVQPPKIATEGRNSGKVPAPAQEIGVRRTIGEAPGSGRRVGGLAVGQSQGVRAKIGGIDSPGFGGRRVGITYPQAARFTGALAKLPKTQVRALNDSGKEVGLVPHLYHPSAESVGLAAKHSYDGGALSEHEYIGKNGRSVRAVGRILLDQVTVQDGSDPTAGFRFGVWPISPVAFGERLSLLAETFEQVKCNRLRVQYVPSVPSTTIGALALYARMDTSAPMVDLGIDELRHAATHPSFSQFQVWDEGAIDITPKEGLKEYFTSGNGDARMEIMGVITCLAASGLDPAAIASAGSATYGTLFLQYDFDFSSEELSYVEDTSLSGNGQIIVNAVDFTAGTQFAMAVTTAAIGAGQFGFKLLDTIPPSSDLILWIIPQKSTLNNFPLVYQGQTFFLTPGQCLVVRFKDLKGTNDFTNSSMSCYMYTDFDSASQTDAVGGADDGVTIGTDAIFSGTVDFKWRAMSRAV